MVAYSGMKSVKSNTANCQVKQLKDILLAHGLLHFVAFVLAAIQVCLALTEIGLLLNKISPILANVGTCCIGLFQSAVGFTTLALLITLTVKTFVEKNCEREAPLYFAFAKPYIIGAYSLMAGGAVIGVLVSCLVCCGAIGIFACALFAAAS